MTSNLNNRASRAAARVKRSKHNVPPLPTHTPSPSLIVTSARPARGTERAEPCLGCLRSALAGRSTGVCHNASGDGARCWRCASGHRCEPIPTAVLPLAFRLIKALKAGKKLEVRRLRIAVRACLEEEEREEEEEEEEMEEEEKEEEEKEEEKEEEIDENDDERGSGSRDAGDAGDSIAARRARARELFSELIDILIT